jgi:hypothetical protein
MQTPIPLNNMPAQITPARLRSDHQVMVAAVAIVRNGTMSETKIYDFHVFHASHQGKAQVEAKIAEKNTLCRNILLFLTGRRYALYCADASTVHLTVLVSFVLPANISHRLKST